jgi:hypothetical protein
MLQSSLWREALLPSSACAPCSVLALGACRLVESGAEAFGELQGVVIGPEVKKDQARLLGQHMAMNRSHLDPVLAQRLDDRVDLFANQDEVTGNGRFATTGRLEADGSRL